MFILQTSCYTHCNWNFQHTGIPTIALNAVLIESDIAISLNKLSLGPFWDGYSGKILRWSSLILQFESSLSTFSCRKDISPIVDNCKCYTCQNHTKAYINHLLNVHEMLAYILLEMYDALTYSLSLLSGLDDT